MDFYGILFDMKNGSKVPYSKNYFDTLLAAKLEELGVKTITGVLPLTFTTSETALRSWTIYGNDFQQEESKSTRLPLSIYTDEDKLRDWTIYGNNYEHKYSTSGILPLTFTSHTAGAASDWSISGNDNVGKNYAKVETGGAASGVTFTFDPVAGTVTANGTATDDAQCRVYFNNPGQPNNSTVPPGNYYFSGCPSGGSESTYNCYSWDYDAGARSKKWDGTSTVYTDYGQGNCQVQINGHRQSITMRVKNGYTANNLVFKPMLRPADTSADFEPYQQGVGQRTVNLFDKTARDTNNGYVKPGRLRADGTINEGAISMEIWVTEYIPVDPDTTYTLTDLVQTSAFGLCYYDSNKDYISGQVYNVENHGNKTVTTPNNCQYIRFTVVEGFDSMLVKGSTAPQTYIPYGYEIPLAVNNTTQDIYIGSAPLTAGQSVSKTSTGVDIAAIAGSNTITTELYNKPEMSIEGVDYVGVGEPTNDGWQIPLTVSDGTNTTTVNIPIDAPLTASGTATKTSTGVDITTYVGTNTISTTLENKPEMRVDYGYKGVGEHSGDTWELYFITSANGNQQLTKITMNKPLRAGETLTSEQAGVTIPTYADAENTLSLYPSAAGYGNPEMSITYKGG